MVGWIGYNRTMEKRKRFAYKFAVVNYVLMGVMIAGFVGYLIYTVLKLAGVGALKSYYPAFDIIMLVLMALLTGYIALLIFHSGYTVDAKGVDVWHLKHIKIPMDKVLLMRYEMSTKMTVLYYADPDQPEGVGYVVVNVFEKDRQEFVSLVQKHNPDVGLEMFDQSKKDTQKDD